jgi:hypothetical protein
MHFYMHSYLHKNFILVKSGCYTGLPVCIVVVLSTTHTLKNDKECVREERGVEIGLYYLIRIPRTESCRVAGLLGLLHRWNRKLILFSK